MHSRTIFFSCNKIFYFLKKCVMWSTITWWESSGRRSTWRWQIVVGHQQGYLATTKQGPAKQQASATKQTVSIHSLYSDILWRLLSFCESFKRLKLSRSSEPVEIQFMAAQHWYLYSLIQMSHWRHKMVDCAKILISCQWLNLLRKASHW